ncbi:MAG: hypothetical protein QG637_1736, partial [Chloroflexota bacterium]|nr:hypothetical protein [Chloroflexota bacterium]
LSSSKGGRFDRLSDRADESRAREADDCAFIETGHAVGIRTRTRLYGLPFVAGTHRLADEPYIFFDLATDPYQLRDLAGTGEQADVAADLDRRLRAWDARTPWMNEILDD